MNCFRQLTPYNPGAIYSPAALPQPFQPFQPFQPSAFPTQPIPTAQGLPVFPTGAGTGQAAGPMTGGAATPKQMTAASMVPPSAGPLPAAGMGQVFTGAEQPPQTVSSTLYTPGFLKTQIGRRVRVEFLIGTNGLTDRLGTLIGVGASYILLREAETDDVLLADIYGIKFVTFYL